MSVWKKERESDMLDYSILSAEELLSKLNDIDGEINDLDKKISSQEEDIDNSKRMLKRYENEKEGLVSLRQEVQEIYDTK